MEDVATNYTQATWMKNKIPEEISNKVNREMDKNLSLLQEFFVKNQHSFLVID